MGLNLLYLREETATYNITITWRGSHKDFPGFKKGREFIQVRMRNGITPTVCGCILNQLGLSAKKGRR